MWGCGKVYRIHSEQLPSDEILKKEILDSVGDLPPMPQAMQKAREILADPNSSFKDLAIVLVSDQAIAAKVLKLANSAYYGLSKRVSSIKHAAVVLGYRTIAELVSLAATSKLMGNALNGYGLKAGELWHHSLAVAFGARFIANKKHTELLDDAFTAGLIHDVGKLVLDAHILKRRQAFEDLMAGSRGGFLIAERHILGLDHAETAFEVCKRWNLPADMSTGIRYHHDPAGSQGSELANILHVADGLAIMSGLGAGIDALSYKMDDSAVRFLSLRRPELEKIMKQVVASVHRTTEEFRE
ncbi:MAG: HDOD domain-containing protein [Thermodesulfobacteriota bacterium]|nr:HDOD domain-containing protein [Thermodesulfobacteriota bacterium]